MTSSNGENGPHRPTGFYRRFGKRMFDIGVSAMALMLGALPLAVLAWLVRRKLGKPALFCQERPGLNGKPFLMFKFRSMTEERDGLGQLLPDEQRLPPFGRRLRNTSLDELPELFNVLKGDMSLVGPRPLLMRYLPRYSPEQRRRHAVKPGITGWAQVNGRNALAWEKKFELDVWYVDHLSFWLDMKIIGLTAWKTLRRDGVSQPGQATMEEFRGA